MKVALINSAVRFALVKLDNFDRTEPVQAGPSHGLLSIAGVLNEAGCNVINIDPNIFPNWEAFVDHLQYTIKDVDVVGVSSYSSSIFNDGPVIRLIRELMPRMLIIAGGYTPTFRPQMMLEVTDVDMVIAGDGESAFKEAVSVFEKYQSRHPLGKNEAEELLSIPGTGVRFFHEGKENAQMPSQRNRLSQDELESLPPPLWEIAPLDDYKSLWGAKYINFSTTRSCDRNCPFCSIVDFHGQGVRLLKPGTVADVILNANNRIPDLEFIFFCDAHFTWDQARVEEICEKIACLKNAGKINNKLEFGCEARVDTISASLLDTMREAGFSEIWIGLESGSDKVLREYVKGQSLDNSRKAVKLVSDKSMTVIAFLMIASPYSTFSDVISTLDLAVYVLEQGGDITPDVSYCLIAWEGTRLIQQVRDQDLDIGFIFGDFSKRELASGRRVNKYIAEGGYVLPADPTTRRLIVSAYLHANLYGKMNTSTFLAGFFMSIRDVFNSCPQLRDNYAHSAREIYRRARKIAMQRRVNNWGAPFEELIALDPLLL